jgi:hypothetical protein
MTPVGAVAHRATDFIPPEMKTSLLVATRFAEPGETVEWTFDVLAVAGRYPCLCTLAGTCRPACAGFSS